MDISREALRNAEDLVFGLDIGTRSIVGTVGYMGAGGFKVVDIVTKEHETRAMLDGQIHDINKVGETIRYVKHELEKKIGKPLRDVCIAAAGRVLKTVLMHEDYIFEEEMKINSEHIYTLDLLTVEKAHKQLAKENAEYKFYCVGYTPVKYYLNDYEIGNLEGHKAQKIGVDLLATFLPEEVVDGLYSAVDYAGLSVANLTLEPIAAMNVAIPENFRLLNIGLVDVGAGTSDICITKDGSVTAYGMIPSAGDELTEIIAKTYLVDFLSAEKIKLAAGKKKTITYKDVLGISHKVTPADVQALLEIQVDKITGEVAKKICELNGGKPVSAVFVVGGGGKFPGFTRLLAKHLGIAEERVALRGEEVLREIEFMTEVKKDPLLVTPIGICINYYNQKNNFIFATINGERIKLYDNNHLTVVDAVVQAGMPNDCLFPKRGKELTFTVNGKSRLVRGEAGEPAVIKLNGASVGINARITKNDIIEISESTAGEEGCITVGELEEYKSTVNFKVNDINISCPKYAYVNGVMQPADYGIKQDDKVVMENYYSLKQLFDFMDIDMVGKKILVNNAPADENTIVYENFDVKYSDAMLRYEDLQEAEPQDIKPEKTAVPIEPVSEKQYEAPAEKTNQPEAAIMPDKEEPVDITVIINNTPVTLSGKSSYVFVNIFDFYPFDLTKANGVELITRTNGRQAEFTAQLNDGDVIELYWRK